MAVLEICVDSVESAIAAEQGGAQRVELCSALSEGGLTPSLGLIRAVRSRISIGLHVMIRPRAGDFLYSADELAVMRDDIARAAECDADGIAIGLLTADGDVDVERTSELVKLARPLEVTFHRAIDMARDVEVALQDVIRTGAERVLTSGGEPSAMQGRHRIRDMVRASAGRISIMAGGGVRPENAREIAGATGAQEYHAALRRAAPDVMRFHRKKIQLGDPTLDGHAHKIVRAEDVQSLRETLGAVMAESAAMRHRQ